MKRRAWLMLLLLAVGAVASSTTLAEVSTDCHAPRLRTLVMGIIEESDPIGATGWQAYRDVHVDCVLNADGFFRNDGRPDVAWRRPDGAPMVVWSYRNLLAPPAGEAGDPTPIEDHDIAFAVWAGTRWGATQFLTWSPENELDPRAFATAGGGAVVVWWVPGPPARVFLLSRPNNDGEWGIPQPVTGDLVEGRRPSVAVYQGQLRVAYESPTPSNENAAQEVVVARWDSDSDGWITEVAIPTARAGRLDPILHVKAGRLWLDWKHGAGQAGFIEFVNGSWTEFEGLPWTDPSWVGVEEARQQIEASMTGDVLPGDPTEGPGQTGTP